MTELHRPKVTIAIPVYNGADYVAEAIDSALAQSYPNLEILVVNDGSRDDGVTERIAQSYGSKIRYLSKTNGGVASALNLAVAQMRGEYLSWLSHDDLYAPGKVEREINAVLAASDGRTIVYSNYAVFNQDIAPQAVSLTPIQPEQFRYWITTENTLHGCTLLIPKIAFDECGVFDETLRTTQDYDLWFRMAEKFRFVFLPEVLVKARSHPEQGTKKLADTVVAECNVLLGNFVDGLSANELLSGSGRAPAVAYALLCRNLLQRGFFEAARRARSKSLQSIRSSSIRDRLTVVSILLVGGTVDRIYGFLAGALRSVLPPSARRLVRRFLNLAMRGARILHSPVDSVRGLALKDKFSEVYAKNIFGGPDSRSGAGSDLLQTEIIRREIPRILRETGVRSMLDAPCGDWFWMREVNLGIERYIGVDIVDALIASNQAQFGRGGVSFDALDLSKDKLPKVDLIFSRDCLVHLSFDDTLRILRNFKASGAKYLLTTTFTDRSSNEDLGDGFWRPLNMQIAPFNFPPPIQLVNEGCTEGRGKFGDKSIGLWAMKDLSLG